MSLKKKPAKRLIGYARVSTQQQDLARQVKALKRAGCKVIHSDAASGKSMAGRPELAAALEELDAGDELVIAEWDRATRSMWNGLQIIHRAIDAGASIKVLDRSYIDLTTPSFDDSPVFKDSAEFCQSALGIREAMFVTFRDDHLGIAYGFQRGRAASLRRCRSTFLSASASTAMHPTTFPASAAPSGLIASSDWVGVLP
jgi:Resolvase, N terminal domain